MKNVFAIFILFFSLPFFSNGQIWNTKIPYESGDALSPVKQLIKTNDNGFLVLIRKAVQENVTIIKQYLLKYDKDGQLVWEKEFDFGVNTIGNGNGANPFRIIELNSDEFIVSGIFQENGELNCYNHKLSSEGDSLFFTMSNFDSSNCILPRFYINSNLYSIYKDIDSELVFLATLNENTLTIIDEVNLGKLVGFIMLDKVFNITVLRNSFSFPFQDTIRRVTSSGNLIHEEIYDDKEIGRFLNFSQNGDLTAYEFGLIQFNEDLSQKWKIEAEDLLFVPDNTSLIQIATGLLPTSDNGFILTGRFGSSSAPLFLNQIYLIKVDEAGQWEWGYVYSSFDMPFNHIGDIVEVSDGYVFVGTSEATEEIWLVKLNKNGTTSIEHIKEQKKLKLQLFPNPVKEILNIKLNEINTGLYNWKVLDISGQVIKEGNNSKDSQINFSKIENGFYFLQININHKVLIHKVIVAR